MGRTPGEKPRDVLEIVFHTRHARDAAEVFLRRICENGGWLSEAEMSDFATGLASGRYTVTMSRAAFYGKGGVVRVLMDLGLLGMRSRHVAQGRPLVPSYYVVEQPVGSRPPDGPSLLFNAWLVGKMWNAKVEGIRAGAKSVADGAPTER